jgi:parallel beta-helix repeat protein
MGKRMIKKGLVVAVILLFVWTSIIPSVASKTVDRPPLPTGNTLYVGGSGPNNYSSIQSAVDDALDGDTVFVYDDSSPYNEHVEIAKSISLIGEDTETTVINAVFYDYVINLSADSIKLSGFTLRNGFITIYGTTSDSEISYLKIEPDFSGIYLLQSSNNIISNNIINGYGGYNMGIYLSNGCMSNTISNNQITQTILGMRITDQSNKNKIQNNEFSHNLVYGLEIYYCYLNIIRDNNFISNGVHCIFNVSAFNLWWGNYWDDWTSTEKRPIEGIRFGPILQKRQDWTTYDWRPAQEPYDI